MTISDQLRRAIEQSGMTRYRISKESGVSQASLSRFVNGETDLSLTKADAICRLLGLSLETSTRKRQTKKPKGPKKPKKR